MIKTFSSYSFGCRVNHAEREEIDRQMTAHGITQVTDEPDVFIINTCSVTHDAERSARQLIYQTKRKNPNIKIVVTGCSATYWLKNGLYQQMPVDLFVDNTHKEFLVKMVLDKLGNNNKQKAQDFAFGKFINTPTDKFIDSNRLVIKIQDGCHRFCTFCIVPYLRGLPKSTSIEAIINSINDTDEPLHEVILTAINTEAFGKDTNETLVTLIKTVINKTTVDRISFGSIHPWSITDEFLSLYQNKVIQKRLVHFFHIPLQSGSNKILQLMRRVHTKEDMLMRINKIVTINPKAFVATDIIVGFLDEEDEDFNQTYEFLQESPIVKFHVFRFSKRMQTAAYFMSKRMREPSDSTKRTRAQELRQLSDKKYINFLKSLIGYTSNALLLQKKQNGMRMALLDNQIPIVVQTKLSNDLSGLARVKVNDIDKNTLIVSIAE